MGTSAHISVHIFMSKPTIAIVLDRRRMSTVGDNKGKYHIKVRVTFKVRIGDQRKWVKRMYRTGYYAAPEEFVRIRKNPRTEEHKKINDDLFDLEKKAKKIIKDNTFINEDIFERQFTGSGGYDNIIKCFDVIIFELEESGNAGNALVYKEARSSFVKFAGESINFYEVTVKWLKKYETWMGERHAAASKNIRCLRSVFNRQITYGKIPADIYPFARNSHDRNRYKIPKAEGTKYALDEFQLSKLLNYKTEDKELSRALDFWHLTYLLQGLNMADILRLRIRDVNNDVITIMRFKTRNTTNVKKKMVIPVSPEAREIIARHGARSLNPGDYLFQVLNDNMTQKQEIMKIHDFSKEINSGLKTISRAIGFPFSITLNIARHTFATLSIIRGMSLAFVMEALGHTSMKTTLNYFHGFDIATKRRLQSGGFTWN